MKKQVLLSVDHEDYMFLKLNGINRSEFMRQALTAYKEGKFVYDMSKQK